VVSVSYAIVSIPIGMLILAPSYRCERRRYMQRIIMDCLPATDSVSLKYARADVPQRQIHPFPPGYGALDRMRLGELRLVQPRPVGRNTGKNTRSWLETARESLCSCVRPSNIALPATSGCVGGYRSGGEIQRINCLRSCLEKRSASRRFYAT
jgi:hypothetical protein